MKRLLTLILACSLVHAQKKTSIQRFGESDLQVIHTKMRFTTLIVLPEGEEISEVTCGDKEYWVIEGKDNIVYVKPSKEGALTNVNIISKSKVVYSFLVQEISKPGMSREKPDLKVTLGDELLKLRKEKENLEEALGRSEHARKEATDKGETDRPKKEAEQPKKKEEAEPLKAASPKVETTPSESKPTPEVKLKPVAVPLSLPTPTVEPPPPSPAPAAVVAEETPIASTYVVEKHEGFLRTSGRAIGRFFRRVGEALRIY